MAHDGFPGAFNELPWPLTQAAAASLQAQLPYPLSGAEWEHDAAMCSLVPSPASTVGGAGVHEAVLMEHLASRLGVSMPSPPLPSPSSRYGSCYSTPVGSPSKPVNAAANVGFAERAARLPCFTASNGKLSRVASSQSLLAEQTSSPRGVAPAHGSSSDGPSRKRKAAAGGKSKAKDTMTTATAKSPEAERRAKKSKLSADVGDDDQPRPAAGEAGHGNDKGKELVAEPPKDYIHVRARRGQATDSHSLAERVRREKISERMKLLQDIVPGCSKVTGKAVMLDEIINYVQSLQRQVEFLSMKLSTVNPRLEVDVDSFVQKDANQSCVPAPTSLPQPPPPPVYSTEGSNTAFCYTSSPAPAVPSPVTANAKSFEPSSLVSHGSIQDHSLEGFENSNPHQIASPWVDDLQSLVQMGFRGNT